MSYLDDPRVYFAAERTLLAWIRTAIALMGFGFVLARFGIFLEFVTHGSAQSPKHTAGLAIGIALVLLGSGACIVASRQFSHFLTELSDAERPVRYLTTCGPCAAYLVAAIGILLAAYLLS